LVLADGGFDAQRDSEDQEGLALRLIACQAGAAISLLATGGALVLKCFNFQHSRTIKVTKITCACVKYGLSYLESK
jgi:hypothetical protein